MRKVSKSIPEDTAFDRDITLHIHLFVLTCSVCSPPGDFKIILCAKRRSTITGKSFIEAYLLMIGTIVHAPRGAQSSCIIFSSKLS